MLRCAACAMGIEGGRRSGRWGREGRPRVRYVYVHIVRSTVALLYCKYSTGCISRTDEEGDAFVAKGVGQWEHVSYGG